MKRIRMDDYNYSPICDSTIDYCIFEKYIELVDCLKKQSPLIMDEEIKVLFKSTYSIPEMYKTATNCYGWKTEFRLRNVILNVVWLNTKDGYTRAYSMKACVEQKDVMGQWQICKKVHGNQVFLLLDDNLCDLIYHFCSEVDNMGHTNGKHVLLSDFKTVVEDRLTFSPNEYHFKEFLEDILGDAG